MPVVSIGDMAQQFTSLRNSGAIKTDLARLSESLSTGKVTDITTHLGGETARFSGIKYSLTQLAAYGQAASETQQTLANVQIILGQVENIRGATAERLLLVSDSSTIAQIDEAAIASKDAFEIIVRALNTKVGDRALLAGADVTGRPLAAASDMLNDLRAAIGVTVDPTAILATIATWFDDPLGGFATAGYLGDVGTTPEKRVSETKTVAVDARADDPAIISVLKATAISALAHDLPGLDRQTKSTLLQGAGQKLFAASSDLIAVQSRIGFAESRVAQAQAESSAQQTALGIMQNNLVSADPFETASQLQAVQLQLETHFTVTARMSQLSLLRYI